MKPPPGSVRRFTDAASNAGDWASVVAAAVSSITASDRTVKTLNWALAIGIYRAPHPKTPHRGKGCRSSNAARLERDFLEHRVRSLAPGEHALDERPTAIL